MEILQIAALGMTGVLMTALLKSFRPEFAIFAAIATVILIFLFIFGKLTASFLFLKGIYENVAYGKTFFPVVIKVLAIAYIADFSAQLARDGGEAAIAGKIELAGKVLIFFLAIPIITEILSLVNAVLG